MARPIWNGSISFGLVTIPIKLYNAVSRKSIRFNQLDERTSSRIRYRKVSAADGEEVPDEHIVKAWEHGKGQYVVVDDDELAALAPKASRTIGIEAFVDLEQIDPVFYDAAYYAAPVEGFEKAYKLLVEAMANEGKVAIARFVRNNKEYLAALRPNGGKLDLSTMAYADEVLSPKQIDEFDGLDDVELTDAEMAMATQLVESLVSDFEPERYHDTYREQVMDLLRAKAAGEEIVAPEAAGVDDEKVVDLLAALEASVAAAKEARGRHPTATKKAAKKKATAKKAAAKKPARKSA
jgi:DNA end-binding protein Ku